MDSFTRRQNELTQMKELGEYLQAERQKQQLTLKDMNQRTRISPTIIEAIEKGDFEKIGTPILIRGFLRAYCRELGIDSESILEEYDRKIRECDKSRDNFKRYESWLRPFRKRSHFGVYTLFLVLVLGLGVLMAKDWIAQKKARLSSPPESMRTETYPQQEEELLSELDSGQRQSSGDFPMEGDMEPLDQAPESLSSETPAEGAPSDPAMQSAKVSQEQGETPEASPGAGAAPTEESFAVEEMETGSVAEKETAPESSRQEAEDTQVPEKPPEPEVQEPPAAVPDDTGHRLYAEADQETWIQVSIDGGKKVQGVLLKPGETKEWEGEESMEIVVGNAGGIRLTWNGTPLKPLGKSGQVVHLNLPDPQYLE